MADVSPSLDDMRAELEEHKTPEEFEELCCENGETYWWQSDLQVHLGYADRKSFDKAVNRAVQAVNALGLSVPDNFRWQDRHREDGTKNRDCRLSRFACYLTAMNADPKKPEVARAQAYFATLAEAARKYFEQGEAVERVVARDEVSIGEKSLSRAAKSAGVSDYALFRNAGYRGLYNMNLRELKRVKGVKGSRTPLDFMGKEELAANLFRITQTEAKLRNKGVQDERTARDTAFGVGREVRTAIKNIGGTPPEELPPSEDIKKVRTGIKRVGRELGRIDKK